MRWFFFTPCALRQHFGTSMLGAVKRQPAALDQHPAADNVIHHQ